MPAASPDDADNDDSWDIDEVVDAVVEGAGLGDEPEVAIRDCVAGSWPVCPSGWIVLWWLPSTLGIEGAVALRNILPGQEGWNAILVPNPDQLLEIVVDAADQAVACTVVDIDECF